MSDKSLMIILFLVILFPIAIVTANIELFIVLGSVVLLMFAISSIRFSYTELKNWDKKSKEKNFEQMNKENEEISELIGIDIKKFSNNIIIARNIMMIVYFVCSMYFLSSKIIKSMGIIIIAYYVYDVIGIIDTTINNTKEELRRKKIHRIYFMLNNILIITFTLFVIYLKITNNMFD